MRYSIAALALVGLVTLTASCGSSSKTPARQANGFPSIDQGGKTAIVAHRGFWKCEAAGFSENSIASLKAAQDNGLWGSECDVQLTKDGVVIVNHNSDIDGLKIRDYNWDELKGHLLPNGERRPTLDEYLTQTAKCKTTKLIIELKKQKSVEREDMLVDKTIAAMKAHKLYNPQRIIFISFSRHMCDRIAAEHPAFVNQFLTSDLVKNMSPAQFADAGINGIDYLYGLFQLHNGWVKEAHDRGMSVNAWTVDKESDINDMIGLGVDQITTNEPLLVRQLLGEKELKNVK